MAATKVAAWGFRLQHGGQGLRTVAGPGASGLIPVAHARAGHSRSGRTTARPGGKLAMGQALIIEVRHEQGCAIVTAAGEIDISTVTGLRERLLNWRPAVAR